MYAWYKKYMVVVGICGQFLFYSQFYTIIQNKSARDISLFGFMCGFISVASWMIYGFMIHDKPLIVANVVATIGALLTVVAILIYQ